MAEKIIRVTWQSKLEYSTVVIVVYSPNSLLLGFLMQL